MPRRAPLLVLTAVLGASLAAPAAPASAAPEHRPHVRPQHRTGTPAPATTAASVIDVVLPLHVSPTAHKGVDLLAGGHQSQLQRRTALRALAPAPSQSRQAVQWARAQGFTVTATTPWSVSLRGRAGALAKAFGTDLGSTQVHGKGFVRPRTPAVVPRALRGVIDPVVGLDTRPIWSGHAVYGGGDVQVLNRTPIRGKTAGAGATVATVNLSGWHSSDLVTYRRAAFGTAFTAPATTYVVVGSGHAGATVDEDDFGAEAEVALDAEAIAGIAPAAKQRMYFGSPTSADYIAILNRMAADLLDADATNDFVTASTSWGACELELEDSEINAMRSAITQITAAGATFFAASGDSGAFGCSMPGTTNDAAAVDFPASAESAVAVGGTSVTGDASGYTSTAWSGSGGGCSVRVPIPARQAGLGLPCAGRAVPDIAAIADPDTGYWVFDRLDQWVPVGGTSLAAPASAAGLAVAMAHAGLGSTVTAVDDFLDLAYQHPSAFTDITSGTNGTYRTTAGYDLVTGLGSPLWTEVESLLTAAPAPTPSGHNEPLLAVVPTYDPSTAFIDYSLLYGGPSLSGFSPNGEVVTGYALSGVSATSCVAATEAPPQEALLPGTEGTVLLTASIATPDVDVPGGCITVQRPVVVDSKNPVPALPAVSYVGTTSPAYRFSWATSGDPAPSSGILFYVITIHDVTINDDVDMWFTSGRAYPLTIDPAFKAAIGHRYTVDVVAVDGAWNSNHRAAAFQAPYDDRTATLSTHLSGSTRVSDWKRTTASADYAGSHVASSRPGAYFGLTFTGKKLDAGVLKSRYGGYADVYVDGVKKFRISLYSSTTKYRQQLRLATFSAAGKHSVVVRVVGAHASGALGSYVFLDSLSVG